MRIRQDRRIVPILATKASTAPTQLLERPRHPLDDGRSHERLSLWLAGTQQMLSLPVAASPYLDELLQFQPVDEVRKIFGDTFVRYVAEAKAFEVKADRIRLSPGRYLVQHEDGLGHRLSRPHEILLELTSRCNFSCPYCCLGELPTSDSKYDMPMELFTRIFDELEENPVFRLIVTGGEPLLWQQRYGALFPRLERIRALGTHTTLFSNAVLLDRSLDEVAACFDKVVISLDGVTPATFAALSGRAGRELERVLKATESLSGRTHTQINTVANQLNAAELPQIVERAAAASIDIVNISRQFSLGRAANECANNDLSDEAWRQVAAELQEHASTRGWTGINIDKKQRLAESFPFGPCKVGRAYMVINHDGTVSPCIGYKSDKSASLRDTSIAAAWNAQGWATYRDQDVQCPVPSQQKVIVDFRPATQPRRQHGHSSEDDESCSQAAR
ncbi:MAG: radical SAM protein [Burkholderiales bacterium]|nr:radical SAM protein [Burkholderiales bacterium]